ncbi:MAG: family 10 glycosylhydrolase [Bacilli bacterium]|jgi:uncharacterized lipoprotein YddW (UPF0748 family)|nr:family 10 glycosylhydrolase [Bacilli bacterium]MDY0063767.1 family 10 glycosylhydrolase [Bacilli bacterium]
MKKVNRFVRGGFVQYFDSEQFVEIAESIKEKKQETRGIWFSTVGNIDFEKMTDIDSFQEYFKGVIQKVKEYHFNTVVFQVRPSNDAFYQSELNPWSRFITGEEGKNPGFDFLAWFIAEAKKEQIDVHAWINPYRISTTKMSDQGLNKMSYLETLSEKNFARLHPECVIETELSKLILDPASEAVQAFVSDTALEIARNYDVKAIHIDDYFYPYEAIIDPDEEAKRECLNPDLSLADFRRENVSKLMKQISDKLKTLPKKVEFGISPFGIYRTNSVQFEKNGKVGGWEKGSNNHYSCYQGYEGLYADVLLWMQKGWIDYVVPQVYFELDQFVQKENEPLLERVKYADLVDWWTWACKETKMKLYIGQGLYRYSKEGNWSNPEEIINQLKYNETKDNIAGVVMFTYRNLVKEDIPALVEARKLLKEVWTKPVLPR